jgi:hypothetical protein
MEAVANKTMIETERKHEVKADGDFWIPQISFSSSRGSSLILLLYVITGVSLKDL